MQYRRNYIVFQSTEVEYLLREPPKVFSLLPVTYSLLVRMRTVYHNQISPVRRSQLTTTELGRKDLIMWTFPVLSLLPLLTLQYSRVVWLSPNQLHQLTSCCWALAVRANPIQASQLKSIIPKDESKKGLLLCCFLDMLAYSQAAKIRIFAIPLCILDCNCMRTCFYSFLFLWHRTSSFTL